MAWNDNPKVRSLAAWAKTHGFSQVVAVGIKEDGFECVSVGTDKRLCDSAKKLSDEIFERIRDGDIEVK